jgi:entericidin B
MSEMETANSWPAAPAVADGRNNKTLKVKIRASRNNCLHGVLLVDTAPESRHAETNPARRKIMLKKTLLAIATLTVVASAVPLLSACNTTAGAGKDIEAAGEAINESAEENKDY